MEKYLSVSGITVTEKVIQKSRFITTSTHAESEEGAKNFIAEISSKYKDATHNCYAYICDKLGNFLRFSDDGEPQGTAGMPMLEVLKSEKLFETAVVVTRYFGGIKLGAGGLVRAYSGCASENLKSAQKVLYEKCAENRYVVGYPQASTILRLLAKSGANVINTEYLDDAVFTVAVKLSEEEELNNSLFDKMNGKIKIEKVREYFFPFKIQGGICPK